MPELPEVETARRLIADEALHRRIADVDDSDTFVCRPHAPGELRAALTGRTLTAARRRGKTMWCETSGVAGSSRLAGSIPRSAGRQNHSLKYPLGPVSAPSDHEWNLLR